MLAAAPLGACSSSNDDASKADADDGFGDGVAPLPTDGGADGEVVDAGLPSGGSDSVTARLVHAIPNLGLLRVCYDPDYFADDPSTLEDESDAGPIAPQDLDLPVSFGTPTRYRELESRKTGALTFRGMPALPDDGGPPSELDDSACTAGVLEAVLPLPFDQALLGIDATADAGARDGGAVDGGTDALSDLAILPTLETTRPVTLLGSGVALDRAGVEAYAEAARLAHLEQAPSDVKGARRAADRARMQIITQRGPLFVIAEEAPALPEEGDFALHVAHLTADITGADGRVGELRVCVTEGTVERPVLPVRESAGLRFRTRTQLGVNFSASLAYRFRFFSRSEFDADGKGCATTSLPPIVQLMVEKGTFKSRRSYTLAVIGATAPASLCSPKEPSPLVRAGCAGRIPSDVAASVLLMQDANDSRD